MYNLKFKALQCNRRLNKFMQAADLGTCGIGEKVIITIQTETDPTADYIKRLEKHIEAMDIEQIKYMNVKYIGGQNAK